MFALTNAATTVTVTGAQRENVPPLTCNTYVPDGSDKRYRPAPSLSVAATARPSGAIAATCATTGFGGHGRSGVATGQLGPATTTPPMPRSDGAATVGAGFGLETDGEASVGSAAVDIDGGRGVVATLAWTVTTGVTVTTGAAVGDDGATVESASDVADEAPLDATVDDDPAGDVTPDSELADRAASDCAVVGSAAAELEEPDGLALDRRLAEVPHPPTRTMASMANAAMRLEDFVD